MESRHRRITLLAAVCAILFAGWSPVQAKVSVWTDVQGTTFKGEPTEILGPFAVFRTSSGSGRRVLLRGFSAEDCRRIYAELAAGKPRAERFAEATGATTHDLPGKVLRVENRELVPADLSGEPEPELLLVLAGSHNSGEGWFIVSNFHEFYRRMQRVYPGRMSGLFLGARHDPSQHRNIATQSGMPWLVADLVRQGSISTLRRFVPNAEGANVVLVTRQGVPLAAASIADAKSATDAKAMRDFMDQVAEFLWLIDPDNLAGWTDRLHYLRATRPLEFASASTGPLLIGTPLRADVLRKYGVRRVSARLAVTAEGKVTPTLLSGPEDVPADLAGPIRDILAQLAVLPAIDHGRPVAGELDYVFEVPPADPVREAERTWLASTSYPAVTIPEWLVLRPIKVSEQDFDSTIIGETPDGTVILNSLEVNTGKISRRAQMSAFNTDWFAEAGADSVRPREGDRQRIDEETTLTWEKVRSVDGFVNMQSGIGKDYVVGYAWTEFESPRATEAWLGLGSDDGVKIWLNGELVHDKWIRRPSRVDDDVVPLKLRQGPNRMLIKIQNATIDWSFLYRLRLKP
ncbi:MAG: hypothetical protein QG602_3464 [Verrucomicrobiota bacterium]|nr:hypothetical protein [Verrucomicrobiota bacterium]